jgi:nucleotide-binding universal stress UspA family protein
VDVTIYPMFAGADNYSAIGVLLEGEREIEGRNKAKLEARLGVEGVPWDWIDSVGTLAECLESAASLADLIVVNRRLDDPFGPDMRSVAGTVLLNSGKPLMAVPQDARSLDLGGHAFVAWDGSEESIDALRAAVPLLKIASRVTLIAIEDGSVSLRGEAAATYLSRYDVHAELKIIHPRKASAAEVILREIADQRPDFLVMGGFGHGRLREAILGGVTRQMLTECPVPLFLVH